VGASKTKWAVAFAMIAVLGLVLGWWCTAAPSLQPDAGASGHGPARGAHADGVDQSEGLPLVRARVPLLGDDLAPTTSDSSPSDARIQLRDAAGEPVRGTFRFDRVVGGLGEDEELVDSGCVLDARERGHVHGIVVRAEGCAEVAISLLGGGVDVPTVTIPRGSGGRVVLRDSEGRPVSGTRVLLLRWERPQAVITDGWHVLVEHKHSESTAADGVARFAHVLPGHYRIHVRERGIWNEAKGEVDVGEAAFDVAMDLPVVRREEVGIVVIAPEQLPGAWVDGGFVHGYEVDIQGKKAAIAECRGDWLIVSRGSPGAEWTATVTGDRFQRDVNRQTSHPFRIVVGARLPCPQLW
jgi:hypothetical protein